MMRMQPTWSFNKTRVHTNSNGEKGFILVPQGQRIDKESSNQRDEK